MRPQHPGHFFVLFHQAGNEIAGASITIVIGKRIDIAPNKLDNAFMILNQLADKAEAIITALC